MALWGDPLYDLAVHLHKMDYRQHEYDTIVRGWLKALPAEYTADWEADLASYLAHEQIKSAIIRHGSFCQASTGWVCLSARKEGKTYSSSELSYLGSFPLGLSEPIDADTLEQVLQDRQPLSR